MISQHWRCCSFGLLILSATGCGHVLSVDITGSGTAISSPRGLQCTLKCSARFDQGSTVVVNANPNRGWTVSSWTGCDRVTGSGCEVSMGSDRTVTLRLDPTGPIREIPGPSAAPVGDWMPNLDPAPADPAELVGSGAAEIYARDLQVVFRSTATVGDANSLLTSLQAKLVGADHTTGLMLLRLPAPGGVREVLDAMSLALSEPSVEIAAPNAVGRLNRLPPHSAFPVNAEHFRWHFKPNAESGSWGLKTLRVPQSWNLLDYVHRQNASIPVLLFELGKSGFDAAHPDLAGRLQVVGLPSTVPLARREIDHGTLVAGIVGATFTNQTGIEGVAPRSLQMRGRLVDSIFNESRQLVLELVADADMRVVGTNTFIADLTRFNTAPGVAGNPATTGLDPSRPVQPNLGPGYNPSFADMIDRTADVFKTAIDRLTTRVRGNFILIEPAGNDNASITSGAYQARYGSLVCNLASRFANEKRYICVEAHNHLNELTAFSLIGGTVSAPGMHIRSTEARSSANYDAQSAYQDHGADAYERSYATQHGTSFAAPFVIGAAAYLQTIEPTLGGPDLYDLLNKPFARVALATVPGGSAGSPRIDVFGAATGIDLVRGTKDIQQALVDVDDGTRDGNLRKRVFTSDPDPDDIHTPAGDHRRGDGRITMRDFRAWRDAYLDLHAQRLRAAGMPGVDLDGPATHFKRDLNFDGCVRTTPANPAHPDPPRDVPVSTECSRAQPEDSYPRYDFNGDGFVRTWYYTSPFKTAPGPLGRLNLSTDLRPPPGPLRDVDVLADADLWNPKEIDGYIENVYVDPAQEGTGGGLPVYPPPENWGVHRYLHGNRDPNQAPAVLRLLPDYIHSMDVHIEIDWDRIDPRVTHILIGQDWPLQSEIWGNGIDDNGVNGVDERFEVTFDRSIQRPRRQGKEYLVATIPLWTGWVRWNWNTESPVAHNDLDCMQTGKRFGYGADVGFTIPDDGSGNGGTCNH